MSDVHPTLTVTEAALIDLQKGKEALARRARNYNPTATTGEPGDVRLSAEAVDAICAPVRLEITFADPIHTRRQIEALQAALVEALVVTQDHHRGINRQRMDLRHIVKSAAEVLVYMNGRTPTGKKPIKARSTS
jgi:hypothetical protein